MIKSEHKIMNGNKNLIICFGGLALAFGGILPFEFLNYLSSIYTLTSDLIFYVDTHQCWYHKGISGITTTIDDTALYLNNIIKNGNYNKVIFMGISAGGYAAILFGSLCNVSHVISFIPQTILKTPINVQYSNLKHIINKNTSYILYGNTSITNMEDYHHILHCENVKEFKNVNLLEHETCNMKDLRDCGVIKKMIDDIITS
jgi:hypothetical protein